MPPTAVSLADNPKNRLYRATQSGTYAVSIPAGVYEVQRQATTNIIIGSTTLTPSTAIQTVFINEPQSSITFASTVSSDVVPWLEGPITNNGTSQQFNFRMNYLPEDNIWYTPTGRADFFWTSTDAITWTSRTRTFNYGTAASTLAKRPGAGNFYIEGTFATATGAASYVALSTNGITWSTTSSRFFNQTGESAPVALFGANTYLVAGYYWKTGGLFDGAVALSTNGVTWTNQQALFSGFSGYQELINAGAFGAGVFALGSTLGSLRTSTDGITWTVRNPLFGGNQISHITFANGRFLAGGANGTLRTSTDSITWTNVNSGMGTADINNILYDSVNNLWTVMSSANGAIRVSTDLITWVSRSSAPGGHEAKSIAWGNGLYVHGYTDTQARSRWFRVSNILTQMPSVPFTDTYIILEYKGTTRTLS